MAVSQILYSKNDVNAWSIDDVTRWLEAAGLTKNSADLQEAFIKQKVDGVLLLALTDEDLSKQFKIKSLGKRKNIVRAINYLKAQNTRAQNSSSSMLFNS